MSFTVKIDPKNTKTKPGKYYAVTPVALSYKKNQMYFEPLIPISIAFTVSKSKTFTCDSSLAFVDVCCLSLVFANK